MKKAIKRVLASIMLVPILTLGVGALSTVPAFADNSQITKGIDATQDNASSSPDLNDVFKNIVNVLLYVIGAVSVVMLIVGGIRYTVSGGDSGQVTSAKNTIMYALIGLVIAFLAYAIVNWVLGGLVGSNTN